MDDPIHSEPKSPAQPGESTRSATATSIHSENEADVITSGLRAMAGAAGGPLQTAVEEFLGGQGDLLEATRAASGKASKTAKDELTAFLVSKLNLSPMVAKLVAPMLLKLFPVLGKALDAGAAEKPAAKPKPKPKTKPKSKTPEKEKPAATSKKKPKKKPAAKPKTPAKKPAKKPGGKTTKKTAEKTASKKKPKTAKRSETAEK